MLKLFLRFFVGVVGKAILSYIALIIISKNILPKEYGIFSMFNTLFSLSQLISLMGLNFSLQRFYSEFKKRYKDAKWLINTCIMSSLFSFIILSTILISFHVKVSLVISGGENFLIIILLLVNTFLSILSTYFLTVIQFEKMAFTYSILQIMGAFINLVLIIALLFLKKSHDSTILITGFTGTNLFLALSSFLVVKRNNLLDIRISTRGNRGITDSKDNKAMIIKYGINWLMASLLSWGITWLDRIFLRALTTFNEIGIYSMAVRISSVLVILQTSFYNFWQPIAYEKFQSNPEETEFFREAFNIVVLASSLAFLIVVAFRDAIKLLIGEQFYESIYVMPFLLLIPVFRIMYLVSDKGIDFSKKVHWHLWISLLGILINSVLNLILIPFISITGAAIATAITFTFIFYTRTFVSNTLFRVNYNLKRASIAIFTLWTVAFISAFQRNTLFGSILPSLTGIGVSLLLYKKEFAKLSRYIISYVKSLVVTK